jgi:hypothetical protein
MFTSKLSAAPDVLFQELGTESVFLDLKSGRYFGLDEVGTRMWQLLTTAESVQASYVKLLAEYDVDAERLRKDLEDLVGKLLELGLVEFHEVPGRRS